MIVNSIMNSEQVSQSQCDNYYLKRKLDDSIENDQFIQSKKRHIQYFSSSLNDVFDNLTDNDQHTNNNQCELQFNLNNNCNFLNECQTIEYLNYDNTLEPVQTTIYENIEHFDPSQWQNTDLLELDQRYNSINLTTCFDKRCSNDDLENIIQSQSCPSQSQEQIQLEEQLNQHQDNQNQQMITNHEQQQLHPQLDNLIMNQNTEQSGQRLIAQDNSKNSTSNLQNESDLDLSWLMNFSFKLDELTGATENQNISKKNLNNLETKQIKPPQSKTGKKVDELIKEVTSDMLSEENDMSNDNIPMENNISRTPKKPPFTYTELIEYALEDKRELTVSGIYQWISDRFPFYKSNDDRWKNSVRHNLSINPHFRKGAKASQGAGHLWTIASRDSEENALAWEHKKQRLELFFKMEEIHNQKYKQNSSHESIEANSQLNYSETELAAATIAQQLLTETDTSSLVQESILCNSHSPNTTSTIDAINGIINDDDLKRSAGDILNGIGRTVEVQPIHTPISTYHDSLIDNEDYLNPITKEQNLSESGLRNEFYVTEIDPIELGINMANVEEEVLFNEEFNLNYFGITSGADIVT